MRPHISTTAAIGIFRHSPRQSRGENVTMDLVVRDFHQAVEIAVTSVSSG